jgi:uncharacterized FlaG/YvyC family protein
MGVPWETVLKIHREELGKKSFDHLEDYFQDLMRFLGQNDALFGHEAQTSHVLQLATRIFNGMKTEIRSRTEARIKADPAKEIGEDEVKHIVEDVLQERHVKSARNDFGFEMDAEFEQVVRERYSATIAEASQNVFEALPLEPSDQELLTEVVVFAVTRNTFLSGTPGVVVAGFGKSDHFPVVCSAVVHGRVADKLKRQETYKAEIGGSNPSIVVPFAQTDAVELFVEGVDPAHALFATKLMSQTLDQFVHAIIESLGLGGEDKQSKEIEWGELAKKYWREFSEKTRNARLQNYVFPLLDVIAVLPKDELAAVAEALVNITSLRRKVSMDAETVGGPIDVAVISKGDGLVWIQRKHYFRPELNPQFFENYFTR